MSYQARHPAAFINALSEGSTKAELIEWLQRTWDEYADARKALEKIASGYTSNPQVLVEIAQKALRTEQP